jgi:hypothetical protein
MATLNPAARQWTESASGWISTSADAPYFVGEDGRPWTPIGQNDAITWPDLAGLYKRANRPAVESYLRTLVDHGVTCLRLMLEYSQTGYRYLERKDGSFNPLLIQYWTDLFDLCRTYGLKVLLTPYDTFWMWNKWKLHPYNSANGGPCDSRSRWLLCSDTRKLIKRRLDFVTERWGGDGTIFAWDLWNEIHPAHASDSADELWSFVEDISTHLRNTEERLHGGAHLQTVSVFLPILQTNQQLADVVYRHPCLDFVNIHLYEAGTIDHPRNTVDAAVSTGRLIAAAVEQAPEGRPVFDSEHGPIHTFKDHHRTLPERYDDEYFRHIQWAHLASGGAGGGMRWPNRSPHTLTSGMRQAQRVLAEFMPFLDWNQFRRRPLTGKLHASNRKVHCFACADSSQAVVYLLRRDTIGKDGLTDRNAKAIVTDVRIPGLNAGAYKITAWDTQKGFSKQFDIAQFTDDGMVIETPPFVTDLVLAVSPLRRAGTL